jgi:hypothetical protein
MRFMLFEGFPFHGRASGLSALRARLVSAQTAPFPAGDGSSLTFRVLISVEIRCHTTYETTGGPFLP